MRRKSAFAVLVFLSFAATAPAQPRITPVEVRQPGVAPPPQQAADPAARARSHDDVDARACLEFLANAGVIRCAEKYRYPHRSRAH